MAPNDLEWWEECQSYDIASDVCEATEPAGDECDVCPVGKKLFDEDS